MTIFICNIPVGTILGSFSFQIISHFSVLCRVFIIYGRTLYCNCAGKNFSAESCSDLCSTRILGNDSAAGGYHSYIFAAGFPDRNLFGISQFQGISLSCLQLKVCPIQFQLIQACNHGEPFAIITAPGESSTLFDKCFHSVGIFFAEGDRGISKRCLALAENIFHLFPFCI